jgi:hypothetical protein
VERLALDIASNSFTNKRRWLFLILKERNNVYSGNIAVNPLPSKLEQSRLIKELQETLGNFVSDICFLDENTVLSFIDSRNDNTVSIDEEV